MCILFLLIFLMFVFRINYTVVQGSPYLEYFQNMASAEDELYNKWKEITLNRYVNKNVARFFTNSTRYGHKIYFLAHPIKINTEFGITP